MGRLVFFFEHNNWWSSCSWFHSFTLHGLPSHLLINLICFHRHNPRLSVRRLESNLPIHPKIYVHFQMFVYVYKYVDQNKRLGCHAGCQDVSWCCTGGESEKSIAPRQGSTQVRIPLRIWNQIEDINGLTKGLMSTQKNLKKRSLLSVTFCFSAVFAAHVRMLSGFLLLREYQSHECCKRSKLHVCTRGNNKNKHNWSWKKSIKLERRNEHLWKIKGFQDKWNQMRMQC